MDGYSSEKDEILKEFFIPSYIFTAELPIRHLSHVPACPVVVFINTKSGGQLGGDLLVTFHKVLNKLQVFDLRAEAPDKVLHKLYGNLEKLKAKGDHLAAEILNKLRLIVAGGDGTANWLLGVICDLKLARPPPVATMPLGTGNNIPFSFGWGKKNPGTDYQSIKSFLEQVMQGREMMIDSWHIIMKKQVPKEGSCDPISPLELPHAMHVFQCVSQTNSPNMQGYQTFRGGFWNYFSIGMDAQVSFAFHAERKKYPEKFKNQLANQMTYMKLGCKQGWFCTSLFHPASRNIAQLATIKIMKKTGHWEKLHVPRSIRSIVCLNLPSFSGGLNPWGTPDKKKQRNRELTPPFVDDGLLEIVGFKDAWHGLVLLAPGGHGTRLAQAHRIRFKFRKGAAHHACMRVDGEPWKQPLPQNKDKLIVEISHLHQVCMLVTGNCIAKNIHNMPHNEDSSSEDSNNSYSEERRKFGSAETFRLPHAGSSSQSAFNRKQLPKSGPLHPARMAESGGERLYERITIDGAVAESALEVDGTLRWRSGGGEQRLRLESEVLGLDVQGTRITVRALAEAPRSGSLCAFWRESVERRRVRRDYSLEMPTEEAALRWSARLKNYIDSLGRPKTLFVILNPFAGNKSARTIFQHEIKPILEAGNINYTVAETMYQNHAQEMTISLDVPKYDGIVCVSGDGILVEVVNGLLKREDWATAIKIPLGIIPAGTGNGMAKSLLDSAGDMCSIANATFAVIRGHRQALDVATISQKEKRFFSVLTLSWGLAADVDIESEKYRWLGSARLDIYAFLRIMNLRKYHGNFQFIPAPGYENHGEPVKQVDEAKSHFVLTQQERGSDSKFKTCGYQGPENYLDGLEWRFVDGPFISIWANNVPFSAENYAPAPKAKFSDGYLDVVILKDCPKSAILGMMLNMSDGSYVKSPYIIYLKVKALRLEPGKRVGYDTKGGIIDCDGEVLAMGDDAAESNMQKYFMAYGPLLMTVDQGLATIFTPVP